MIYAVDGLEKLAEIIRTAAIAFLALIILGIVIGIIKGLIRLHHYRQTKKIMKQLKAANKGQKQ